MKNNRNVFLNWTSVCKICLAEVLCKRKMLLLIIRPSKDSGILFIADELPVHFLMFNAYMISMRRRVLFHIAGKTLVNKTS